MARVQRLEARLIKISLFPNFLWLISNNLTERSEV